jgi:hypothetical protein
MEWWKDGILECWFEKEFLICIILTTSTVSGIFPINNCPIFPEPTIPIMRKRIRFNNSLPKEKCINFDGLAKSGSIRISQKDSG